MGSSIESREEKLGKLSMCKHTRHLFVCGHYGRWPNTQGKMKRWELASWIYNLYQIRLLNPRLLYCACAVLRTRCGLTFHLQQASTCQRYMDLEKIGAFCIILWAQQIKPMTQAQVLMKRSESQHWPHLDKWFGCRAPEHDLVWFTRPLA